MKIIKFIILFLPIQLISQNLILNPSFESSACAEFIGAFGSRTSEWSSPTFGTTDLFNPCATGNTGVPVNFNGNQAAKFGEQYAGCYFYSKNNYREYIQGKFSSSLEKDKKYKVSFYLNLAENSDFAIKSIGFLLTKKKFKVATHQNLSKKILRKLNIERDSVYNIDNDYFLDNTKEWIYVSKEIIATGGEKFITIGNFASNALTPKSQVLDVLVNRMSYYYIDMIDVVPSENLRHMDEDLDIQKDVEVVKVDEKLLIEADSTIVFENVTFNFNSSKLSNQAVEILNAVYEYLILNDNIKVQIKGHTDNIGSAKFNQLLSENRVASVARYLTNLGLNETRILRLGYGNSRPISTNKTDQGRLLNRRVEFKMISQ